jgi:ankyrin repeat protein
MELLDIVGSRPAFGATRVHYPESLQVTNNFGNLPLHDACRYGAPLDIVRHLVEAHPEFLKVTNHDGNLPLHQSYCQGSSLEVVRYLVREFSESLQLTNNFWEIFL